MNDTVTGHHRIRLVCHGGAGGLKAGGGGGGGEEEMDSVQVSRKSEVEGTTFLRLVVAVRILAIHGQKQPVSLRQPESR